MIDPAADRHLAAAELWVAPPTGPDGDAPRPRLAVGWEDGHPFCAAVCSTDTGLAFCRRCPETLVGQVMASGHAGKGQCAAGVRLLAFPTPARNRSTVAVLRIGPSDPRQASRVAASVRVSPTLLRRAATAGEPGTGRSILRAARALRDPVRLAEWQVLQRERGSGRQRAATAALAQFIVVAEEFQDLYRSAQRQRRELARTQRLSDGLARQAVSARELERARVAHQIHDTAAQSMVSAYRFLSASMAAAEAGTVADARAHSGMALERLQTAIREVRSVLGQLVPPGLEFGLQPAIRFRHEALIAEAGIGGAVTGDLPRLQEAVEQGLYGMVVEAMTNAASHARASTLDVDLRVVRGRLVIAVRDDGIGFEPTRHAARRDPEHGLGLPGLARQARWLGGSAGISSRPGHGTTVRISIPLERHRAIQPVSAEPAVPTKGVD